MDDGSHRICVFALVFLLVISSMALLENSLASGKERHVEGGIAFTSGSLSSSMQISNSYSTGFIKQTLVLSNNSLVTGDFIDTLNNTVHPQFIAYNPLNDNLYVSMANGGILNNTVLVVNGTSNRVVDEISVGSTPDGIAYDPYNGNIYVANFDSNNVSVIDWRTDKVIASVQVGFEPFDLAYCPLDKNMYVTDSGGLLHWPAILNQSGGISVIDSMNNTLVNDIKTHGTPAGISYDPAEKVFYISYYSGPFVITFNITNGAGSVVLDPESSLPFVQPYALAYDPANGLMYASDIYSGNVYAINASHEVVASYQEGVPWSLSYNSLNYHMYVASGIGTMYGSVQALNPNSESDYERIVLGSCLTVPSGGFAYGLAFDPGNDLMYVTNSYAGTIAIIQFNGTADITISAKGLAPDTSWTVLVNGVQEIVESNSAKFDMPVGNYSYSVTSESGYLMLSNNSGMVDFNGTPAMVVVSFCSDTYILSEFLCAFAPLVAIFVIVYRRDRKRKMS